MARATASGRAPSLRAEKPVEARELFHALGNLSSARDATGLGRLHRDNRDRVFGGLRIERAGSSGGYVRWRVRPV